MMPVPVAFYDRLRHNINILLRYMGVARQEKKDSWLEIHDKIDALHTDYLRELTGLAKIFITISSAMLGLTLVPFAPDLLIKTAVRWLIWTWIALTTTSVLARLSLFAMLSGNILHIGVHNYLKIQGRIL